MENQTKNWRKQFIPLILGQSISLIGSSAVQFALMWWLASQTNSGTVLSIAGLFAFLPQLIIGPFAGVWVDRMDKKRVVIVADLFTGLVALLLSLSIFFIFSSFPKSNSSYGYIQHTTRVCRCQSNYFTKCSQGCWNHVIKRRQTPSTFSIPSFHPPDFFQP